MPTEPDRAAPAEIATTDVWDLAVSWDAVSGALLGWRALQNAASATRTTVDTAASQVLGDDGWAGDAADSYDTHRRTLTSDIERIATAATSVADTVERLWWTLADAQNRLSTQFEALTATVAATRSGTTVTFAPLDQAQADAVHAAVAAAEELRAGLDEELALAEGTFASTTTDVCLISDAWSEETLRLVNLNIGSGNDNLNLGDKPGVAPEEVDDLAERLVAENADVVTLQEVFETDLDTLEAELEDRTGNEWDVHYAEADTKPRYTSLGDILIEDQPSVAPFGNAVLVQVDGPVAGSTEVAEHKLDEEGPVARAGEQPATPTPGTTTTTVPGAPLPPDAQILDEEARVAIEVEVQLREP